MLLRLALTAIVLCVCMTHYGLASTLEVVAKLSVCPGNITVTPENRIIISLHPFQAPKQSVVELTPSGKLLPFPNSSQNSDGKQTFSPGSVLGIQCDTEGVVWMLDNGSMNGSYPRLIGWDTGKNQLKKIIEIKPPAVPSEPVFPDNFFLNDLAVDLTHNCIYISHSAGSKESGIIVVDLSTGNARRVLEGHSSVIPEPESNFIEMDGQKLNYTLPDSGQLKLLIGVNPIALDAGNEWLYYGTMTGKYMYRIRTADLSNPELTFSDLARKVETYSSKPPCDGISVDKDNNIYVCDLQGKAVGVIKPDKSYSILVGDPRISWPESFSFGADGYLYTVASQLHLSGPLNRGVNKTKPPYYVLRVKPLAPGVVGR